MLFGESCVVVVLGGLLVVALVIDVLVVFAVDVVVDGVVVVSAVAGAADWVISAVGTTALDNGDDGVVGDGEDTKGVGIVDVVLW